MRVIAGLLLCCALIIAADDTFTGKWSGTATMTGGDGQSREGPALLVLKQEGNAVTGTGGPDEQRSQPIQNGKAEGSKLTFEIGTADSPVVFKLTLENGRLRGEGAGSPGGQSLKVKLDLTKGS